MYFQLILSKSLLPLCVTGGAILYDESRSKTIANIVWATSPSGKYDCVVDRLLKQASSPFIHSFITSNNHNNDFSMTNTLHTLLLSW